jgi:hypothetical protein
MFFILARIVFGATRPVDAGLRLPTRLRTLDDDAFLEALFDAVFALEAGLTFFVFDFVVFFDLLRAAIVILSTRESSRTAENPCASAALQYGERALRQRTTLVRGLLWDFRSTINLSFSTKSSKNQRRR